MFTVPYDVEARRVVVATCGAAGTSSQRSLPAGVHGVAAPSLAAAGRLPWRERPCHGLDVQCGRRGVQPGLGPPC